MPNKLQQFTPFKRSGAGVISPKVSGDELDMGSGDITTTGTITGAFDISGFTGGSVLFANATGVITEDNAQFYWDDVNNRLQLGFIGVGSGKLHVQNSSTDNVPAAYFENNDTIPGGLATAVFRQNSTGDICQFLDSTGFKRSSIDDQGRWILNNGLTGIAAVDIDPGNNGFHFQLGGVAGDPGGATDGDMWYNNAADRLRLQTTAGQETIAYLSDVQASDTWDEVVHNGDTVTINDGDDLSVTIVNNDVTNSNNTFEIRNITTGWDFVIKDNITTHTILDHNSGYVFNDSGNAVADFTVKGDTKTMLFVDASADTINLGNTIALTGTIDDDTFATASATTLATSESIKAYVDAQTEVVTTTVYVDGNRVDAYTENGSQARPYKTIQAAITASSAGTAIIIALGTYTEDLTLKSGVHLESTLPTTMFSGVVVTGKVTCSLTGGSVQLSGILFQNSTDHVIDYAGANAQKLRAYNCKFEYNGVGASSVLNATNTNASSEFFTDSSLLQVIDSSGGARCINTTGTSAGSYGFLDTTIRISDNPNNIATNLNGSVSMWQNHDIMQGQVVVASTASYTGTLIRMVTTSVPVVVTNSAGVTNLGNVAIVTTASPTVTGAGVFAYAGVVYGSSGMGFAGTLNGGGGPDLGALPFDSSLNIIYDNSISGLTATRVKTAIDELASDIAGQNELSEILANGNTTGANNIIVTAGQRITTDTIAETTANAGTSFVDVVKLRGVVKGIRTEATTYAVTQDDYTILANAAGGAFDVDLPAAPNTGQLFVVKRINAGGNKVTVDGNGNTIDGNASVDLNSQYESITVQFDGTNWFII